MARSIALALAVVVLAAADAPTKTDSEKIQGTWKLAAADGGTGELPSAEQSEAIDKVKEKMKFTVRKDTYRLERKNGVIEGTIILDPSTSPRTCDFALEKGEGRGGILKGIYQIDGDVLRLCIGIRRPKEFEGILRRDQEYFIMRRDGESK
jgi:uncharacterized protein (TIGR03067 family)